MKRNRFVLTVIAILCLTMLLTSCGGGNGGQGGEDGRQASGELPSKDLPEHWSAEGEGIAFDGQDWESWYISDISMYDEDFRYSVEVNFSESNTGIAALVFQSGDNHKSCYVASVSAMTDRAELYKYENGTLVQLGNEFGLDEKESYELQVVMVNSHIAYFVDDILICSTGDFMARAEYGQDGILMSGKLGLYAGDSKVTFKDAKYEVYEEGKVPVIESLSIEASSGSVETPGNMLANDWYIYQQYVSSDCEAVNILAQTPEGVETVVLSPEGTEITGAAPLRVGQNSFQIFTKTAGEDGRYMLAYRLNVIRRGEGYYSEPYRPVYHYSVTEGWGNDPNGLIKIGDTWHMFYQSYPGGTDWGPMHWMHATSTDLIHWEEKGIEFYPNEFGSMFSGCAVADENNVSGLFGESGGVILYITANSADNGNGQRIIAAYSEDGENWQYYRGRDEDGHLNGEDVLIDWHDDPLKDGAFRDPKVFKYQDKWFLVIAGGLLRIYSSTDLIHWNIESTYKGEPGEYENSSGLRVETECPDLVRLPIQGEDGYKWVLSYGGRRYQVGDFTNTSGKWEFVPEGDVRPMNFGNDSYAAMTYYLGSSFNADTQDRVIEVNWMNSWDYCNRVDDLSSNTRFNGVYNLNLEMSLVRDKNGELILRQKPVEEYAQHTFPADNVALDTTVTVSETPTVLDYTGDAYLLDVTITPAQGTAKAGVWVRYDGESGVSVDYDFATDTLNVDRSSLGGFSSSVRFSQVVTEKREDGSVTLHIYVDKSSVEVFSADYTSACAAQIYPDVEANTGVAVYAEGGEARFDVTVTSANSMRDE